MINPYESGLDLDNASVTLTDSTVIAETGFTLFTASSLLVQSSNITIVNAMDPTVNGMNLSGGSHAEINDSQLTVVGDVPVEVFGILTGDTSTVLINRSDINVMNIHAPPPVLSNAVGLDTTGSSQIQMNEGSLSVSGNSASELTTGTNITLNGVVCTLNGVTVSCP
ncbi:MAG: hypothetical protein RJA83_1188 [Pseudomonadota bacterium]|jgi:hypothetical protein